ncbi:MAG: Ltp family lipoprotein [Firmicutes bacterium]|nr:Ltp family lipoprotein [Bacillota bacterium]
MAKAWADVTEKKKNKGCLGRLLIILLILAGIGTAMGNTGGSKTTREPANIDTSVTVEVADFSTMTKEQIEQWAESNKVIVQFSQEYSDSIEDGGFVKQNRDAGSSIKEGSTIKVIYSLGKEPSSEFKNALVKAELYSKTMYMSKEGIYKQLVSDYGEGFSQEAAQWAIDHLNVDYKENALKKAASYSNTMYMSKDGIYDQLVSAYGENFTKEEAQYAVDNLDADYNKNALMKAKSYESSMKMSKKEIYNQLISAYGEKFTKEQAQYAIDHLDE